MFESSRAHHFRLSLELAKCPDGTFLCHQPGSFSHRSMGVAIPSAMESRMPGMESRYRVSAFERGSVISLSRASSAFMPVILTAYALTQGRARSDPFGPFVRCARASGYWERHAPSRPGSARRQFSSVGRHGSGRAFRHSAARPFPVLGGDRVRRQHDRSVACERAPRCFCDRWQGPHHRGVARTQRVCGPKT